VAPVEDLEHVTAAAAEVLAFLVGVVGRMTR
jgi:hypothetical protein